MEERKEPIVISKQALQRMPYYLQYLEKAKKEGVEVVAAPAIAAALRLNEVQVRKDLAAVSATKGKPRSGFTVDGLIRDMRNFLGYNNVEEAVLVGVGSLGRALLSYHGFDDCAMHIAAAFDADEGIIGQEIGGKKVLPASQLGEVVERLKIHIGIIAVPANQAQSVLNAMLEHGVLAVWNFAPVHLVAPSSILIQNENMAASLALLSKHLGERLRHNALPEDTK